MVGGSGERSDLNAASKSNGGKDSPGFAVANSDSPAVSLTMDDKAFRWRETLESATERGVPRSIPDLSREAVIAHDEHTGSPFLLWR